MDKPEQKPTGEQIGEVEPSPLYFIDKIINIFGWVVKFFLIIGFMIIVFYGVLIVIGYVVPLFQPQAMPPQGATPLVELFNSTFDNLSPIVAEFWNLLKPILQFVIIVVLLRWLFFSQQGPLVGQFRNLDTPSLIVILVISAIVVITLLGLNLPPALTNIALIAVILVVVRGLLFSQEGRLHNQMRNLFIDVPSIIAILIIGTIALITVLGMDIPQALANIGLVIVGFYFGQDRLKKQFDRGEANSNNSAAVDNPPKDNEGTTS